jgi:hypothetical protein
MMTSPEQCLFLESVSTGEQIHTADWIAQDIERVIRHYSSTSIVGAVTDNTAANKKAWKQLEATFPSRYFMGCCAHGLRLLVKDVFAATKTKKSDDLEATYPVG